MKRNILWLVNPLGWKKEFIDISNIQYPNHLTDMHGFYSSLNLTTILQRDPGEVAMEKKGEKHEKSITAHNIIPLTVACVLNIGNPVVDQLSPLSRASMRQKAVLRVKMREKLREVQFSLTEKFKYSWSILG